MTVQRKDEEMFELGKNYRDRVTGFEGMATGHVRYMTGCNQVLLAPRVGKDGKVPDSQWFDEQRLEVADKKPALVLDNTRTPGPDKPAPKY
jgi:hypothetical protein